MRVHFLIHGETTVNAAKLTQDNAPAIVAGSRSWVFEYDYLDQSILYKSFELEAAHSQKRDGSPKEEWAAIMFDGVDVLVNIKSKVWIALIATANNQANLIIGGDRNDIIDVQPWTRMNLTKEDLQYLCTTHDKPLEDLIDGVFGGGNALNDKYIHDVPWDLPYVRALHEHPQLELLINTWIGSMSLKDLLLLRTKVVNLPDNIQIMHDLFAYTLHANQHTELLKKLASLKYELTQLNDGLLSTSGVLNLEFDKLNTPINI